MLNTWFRDEAERQEHIDMVNDVSTWPDPRQLHMKHPERMQSKTDQRPRFGRVLTPGVPAVYLDNDTTEIYTSVEAMIDAGWVVD